MANCELNKSYSVHFLGKYSDLFVCLSTTKPETGSSCVSVSVFVCATALHGGSSRVFPEVRFTYRIPNCMENLECVAVKFG